MFNGYIDQNKKILQYVHFRCGRVHFNNSLRKIGISFNLEKSLRKQEMDHDETYEDTWEDTENEWLPHLKNDVLSTAFTYTGYAEGMEELTGFGMKKSLILTEFSK